MDRLTVRCDNGEAEPIGDALSCQMIDKLCAYEDAEERGELVRVVRCKDCKYSFVVDGGIGISKCYMWEQYGDLFNGEFYCAFGERMEHT